MIVDNTKNFEKVKKFVQIIENISTGCQLVVLILVLLCGVHIVMNVFECHALDALDPFFNTLRNFVTDMFGQSVNKSLDGVDGREVLFVLLGILVAFFLQQLKMGLNTMVKNLERTILKEKERVETEFNEELKQNFIDDILEQDSFVLAFQLKVKWLIKDSLGEIPPTQGEQDRVRIEAISRYYNRVKDISGLKFSKDGEVLIMASNDLENIDNILNQLWEQISAIKAEYKEKKYGVRVKMLIDTHKHSKQVNAVYKKIAPLFNLNANNEILCLGNFKNRYELMEDTQYYIAVKGKYDMADGHGETVWSLMKKN